MGSGPGKESEVRIPARKRMLKEGWSTDSSERGSRNADRGDGDKVTDAWVSESSRETQ